ncbi:MAG: adenylate/guanylate cyclase domain-containing protein [Hyphomicrobiales bacterium]|nr:adenylate/guanylate cyclase domain-containing protein [Hyphomicrobiales bacterium]MCP5371962.1 adenylate/guanylate cyclase domain-containing protein [Hyphomicrobiales bacterium]
MSRTSDVVSGAARFRVPIRTFLVLAFGGLTLLAVVLVMVLGFASAARNTQELLHDKVESLLDTMVARIEATLRPVEAQAHWIADNVASGHLSPRDGERFAQALNASLAATPQTLGAAVILPDGLGRYQQRGQVATFERDWSADPRWGAAARAARQSTGPTWADPVYTDEVRQVIVNIRTPLRHGGEFLGVLVQAVTVSRLSLDLSRGWRSGRGTPFVLYGRDRVLAHPLLIDHSWPADPGEHALPGLADLGDGVLPAVWDTDDELTPVLRGITGSHAARAIIDGTHHIFLTRTLKGFGPEPWTVGVHYPAEALAPQVRRFLLALVAGLAVLVLALVAAWVVGRRTCLPVQRLALEAAKVQADDLDGVNPLAPSLFTELDDAARSFNGMVEGLKERRTIRELFGKYVPERVAAEVLRGGGVLQPRSVEATVLFADLEGFTPLSESLDPTRVVEILNRYFSILVEIVERHDGVVTQFQGDAILACFNVPIPRADHAQAAVQAAVEIKRAVEAEDIAGHRLACRVGVNTGAVVAGNVGAEGRLHYTVNGDAVNLAARLETLNKDHGTRVLISGATAARVQGFTLRDLGQVTVKGKREAVAVFAVAC